MTTAPTNEGSRLRRPRPWWGSPAALSLALVLLAVMFALDPWTGPPPLAPIPPVDKSFLDLHTRRNYGDALVTRDDSSKCSECHEPDDQPDDPGDKRKKGQPDVYEEDHEIHLKHGSNDHCFNCHDRDHRDMMVLRNGYATDFQNVNLVCGSCHGATLRDWNHGAHGRRQGYFDLSRGPYTAARCIDCHDPHDPSYKPLKPAPGPHTLHQEATP